MCDWVIVCVFHQWNKDMKTYKFRAWLFSFVFRSFWVKVFNGVRRLFLHWSNISFTLKKQSEFLSFLNYVFPSSCRKITAQKILLQASQTSSFCFTWSEQGKNNVKIFFFLHPGTVFLRTSVGGFWNSGFIKLYLSFKRFFECQKHFLEYIFLHTFEIVSQSFLHFFTLRLEKKFIFCYFRLLLFLMIAKMTAKRSKSCEWWWKLEMLEREKTNF